MSERGARESKGRLLKGCSRYVKARWGITGLSQCQECVGVDLFDIPSTKWFPEQHLVDLVKWIAENHGLDCCRKAGFSAVAEAGVISYVARVAGISRVLDRGIEDFRDSFNFGDISIERGRNRAVIRVTGICVDKAVCMTWQGAFEGILHITKASGSVTKTACELDGDGACVYELVWK